MILNLTKMYFCVSSRCPEIFMILSIETEFAAKIKTQIGIYVPAVQ